MATIFIVCPNVLPYDCRLTLVCLGKVESGILVLKNNTVFTVGSGPLLGVGGCTFSSVPRKIAQLSGSRLKGTA